jgi:hypothetical protein
VNDKQDIIQNSRQNASQADVMSILTSRFGVSALLKAPRAMKRDDIWIPLMTQTAVYSLKKYLIPIRIW